MGQIHRDVLEFLLNEQEGLINLMKNDVQTFLSKSDIYIDFQPEFETAFRSLVVDQLKEQILKHFNLNIEEVHLIMDHKLLERINFDDMFLDKKLYQ